MSILIPGGKRVSDIYASVAANKINELHLYGKAKQDGIPTPDTPVEIDVAGSSGSVVVKSVGKNLKVFDLETIKSWHSNKTWNGNVLTINGCTLTFNNDGSIVCNGTATENIILFIGYIYNLDVNTDYILSGTPYLKNNDVNTNLIRLDIRGSNGSNVLVTQHDTEKTFRPVENTHTCYIRIQKNVQINNLVFYPMIRLASITDATYEPYEETTATITTPNGLAGIPVGSDGNYTDSNGQQRICDEIVKYADGSGERIQRIKEFVFDDTVTFAKNGEVFHTDIALDRSRTHRAAICSNHKNNVGIITTISEAQNNLQHGEFALRNAGVNNFYTVYFKNTSIGTASEFKTMMVGAKMYYILAEPIRTPLTAEEIAEIEKLSAICPANNVSVSDDCDLSLLIGKRYETKKIVSAWANKDGVPVKVFSDDKGLVIYEVTSETVNGAVIPKEEITPPNYDLMSPGVSLNANSITDVFTGMVLTLTDKALSNYRYIRVEYDAIIEPWTFTYKNNSTSKYTKVTEKPVFSIEQNVKQTKFSIKNNLISCHVTPPTIDDHTFVSIDIAPDISWVVTRITLYE